MTADALAKQIIAEAVRRGYDPLPPLATAIQESSLKPGAVSANGKWIGLFQQDSSYSDRNIPTANITQFFDRLDAKRKTAGWSNDLWLNIFWLQQRPGETSADLAYQNGRKAYLAEIKSRTGEAQHFVALYGGTMPETPARVGDPTWLEDVLRPALGDRLKTLPGWKDSGVGGTMGKIWGVIWHHTGNARADAQSIRNGRPDLAGPLAQLHIAQDGTVTIVAVGPCNHAGAGSWAGLPTDNANSLTIGVECAWPRDTSITENTQTREPWPDAQIIAMRDTAAALTAYLGVDASHNISHEEWAKYGPAGVRQGKWDPGNLDMNWFRGEITKAMNGEFNPPTTTPEVPVPTPNPYAIPKPQTENTQISNLWDQLLIRWDILGGRTPVEALAAACVKLGVSGCIDVKGGN